MIAKSANFPTHLSKCVSRLRTVGDESSADTFLLASYIAEAAIKTIAIALQAGLRERAHTHAYRIGYDLVRADGLGAWEAVIRECTSDPLAAFLSRDLNPLSEWATRKRGRPEDAWYRSGRLAAAEILRELGSAEETSTKPQTIRELITNLVQIRNKTKAHGAVGPDFFAAMNGKYIEAVDALVSSCPVFEWSWYHLSNKDTGTVRAIHLAGESPQHVRQADAMALRPARAGVHFLVKADGKLFHCGEMLRSNREATRFFLPNGGYDGKGRAEFLDYATGIAMREEVGMYVAPPVLPPASETHGLDDLEAVGNVLSNVPARPLGYVQRPRLEAELEERLTDKNHAIITLHGRGGVGKTMLALNAAHRLANSQVQRYDSIVWFSARDVDLGPSGPKFVRPAVVELADIAATYGELTEGKGGVEEFAVALETGGATGTTLFVFDNFETMASIADLHQFLDRHTHLPNKTLITSRERAFKADYPIEVKGMEFEEAREMMRALAIELNVDGVATDDVIRGVFENTEGHAYLIRVVMGEIAQEGRYVPPKHLVSRRLDIVEAVFERSFDKLSEAGRHVFLTVTNWRSAIPAIAMIVVMGDELDVDSGIDECLRLSLINRDFLLDGQPCYTSPLLARMFGQKKLRGDPDRLLIQENLDTIRKFGVVDAAATTSRSQDELTQKFVVWCSSKENARGPVEKRRRLEKILESLAAVWPNGWLALARFRRESGSNKQSVQYALRRAVEEMPQNRGAWTERATYAKAIGDEATWLTSLISAVDTSPQDVEFVTQAAGDIARYITDHADLAKTRRAMYLASIREHLVRLEKQLDANGLSKIAWLYLLEGSVQHAREYALKGLEKEATNSHCRKILDRIGR